MTRLIDSCHRPISYLRVSVTDRCNLRCVYCMPEEGIKLFSHDEMLSYEEIITIARAAADLGISKIRLTGGEPLVRGGLPEFISRLAEIQEIEDISLTTNGILLKQYALQLKQAGLRRVNISLDTRDTAKFRNISRYDRLGQVLEGIEAAKAAGLDPVKINVVAMRGVNDDEILDFANLSISAGWHVRFIELMPFIANTCSDKYAEEKMASLKAEFISITEIKEKLDSLGKMDPVRGAIIGNGPAKYFRFPGAEGTIGFISAISHHFCEDCNRLRLTADGKLRLCLFSDEEIDLRALLRAGAPQEQVKQTIMEAVKNKPKQHQLAQGTVPGKRFMSQVGG
jgi:cyclic pyranopterin phosphate synthase